MPKDVKYPAHVTIKEQTPHGELNLDFTVVIYFVGVYCQLIVNGSINQVGGYNHRNWLKNYLRDIAAAKKRGAIVTETSWHSLDAELLRANNHLGNETTCSSN